MAFLIIIPDRLMAPSRATKPKGAWVTSSAGAMPMKTKGIVRMMINGGRKALNRSIRIRQHHHHRRHDPRDQTGLRRLGVGVLAVPEQFVADRQFDRLEPLAHRLQEVRQGDAEDGLRLYGQRPALSDSGR